MNIETQIDSILEEIISIRRDFHKHPELSEHEKRTSEKISSYLTDWGISHKTGIAGYGIVATVTGTKAPSIKQAFPVIAIRADMDALPICEKVDTPHRSVAEGVMHACGHDIHVATLLGTARLLQTLRSEFHGTVKFFFQPAEETIGGAERMIEEGCMENPKVEAVIGLHVSPSIPSGCIEFCRGRMNAASTEFSIHVEGISSHGAHPDNGVDVILTASHIVTSLQSIVSRNLSPICPGVLSIGQFHAGTKNNILPPHADLQGIIRTFDKAAQKSMKSHVDEIASGTAQAFGATASVEFHDSYPALINDDLLGSILERAALQYFRKEEIHLLSEPSLGAEDFSYFANASRGIYFNLGTKRKENERPQALHNEWFDPDDSCIRSGILMELAGAFALLNYEETAASLSGGNE